MYKVRDLILMIMRKLNILDIVVIILVVLTMPMVFCTHPIEDLGIHSMTVDRIHTVKILRENESAFLMTPLGNLGDPGARKIEVYIEDENYSGMYWKDTFGDVENLAENRVSIVTDITGTAWLNLSFSEYYYLFYEAFYVRIRTTVQSGGSAQYEDPNVNRDIWLTPGENIDSDNSKIIEKSKSLIRGKTSRNDKARAIFKFVCHHMTINHSSNCPELASDVLNSLQGVCRHYSNLFTALSRAAGIPARTVIGLSYDDRNEYVFGHVWCEWLDERNYWHIIDPQISMFDKVPADYFPLVHGSDKANYSYFPEMVNGDVSIFRYPQYYIDYSQKEVLVAYLLMILCFLLLFLYELRIISLSESKNRERLETIERIKRKFVALEGMSRLTNDAREFAFYINLLYLFFENAIYINQNHAIEALKNATERQRQLLEHVGITTGELIEKIQNL
jgi:hypothetical protein